jgi:hypothetical protein
MKTLDKFSGGACMLIVLANLGKQKLFPSKILTSIFISMLQLPHIQKLFKTIQTEVILVTVLTKWKNMNSFVQKIRTALGQTRNILKSWLDGTNGNDHQ